MNKETIYEKQCKDCINKSFSMPIFFKCKQLGFIKKNKQFKIWGCQHFEQKFMFGHYDESRLNCGS